MICRALMNIRINWFSNRSDGPYAYKSYRKKRSYFGIQGNEQMQIESKSTKRLDQ